MAYARKGTEPAGSDSVPIPGEGIGTRFSAVSDRCGTRRNAARVAGVSVDSLARYIKEEAMPPFDVAARLCQATGISMEWLATGVGPDTKQESTDAPSQSVSQADLTLALQLVEEAVVNRDLPMPPDRKAELTMAVVELLVEGVPEAKVLRFIRAT